jgi:carboxypeptidase C (cathepsin A)
VTPFYGAQVFVDQPVGTGFSWSDDPDDTCYDEDCVAADVLDFLNALVEKRADLLAGRELFITGESYAG